MFLLGWGSLPLISPRDIRVSQSPLGDQECFLGKRIPSKGMRGDQRPSGSLPTMGLSPGDGSSMGDPSWEPELFPETRTSPGDRGPSKVWDPGGGCPTTYPCHTDGAEPVSLGHLGHAGPVAVEVAAAVAAVAQQQVLVVVPSPANQAGLGGDAGGLRAALESPSPPNPSVPPTARALTTLLTDFSQAMDFSSWKMHRDTWAALRHRSSVCRHVRTRGVISYELRGHSGAQPGMGVLPWPGIPGRSWGTPPHSTRKDSRPCWPCSTPGRSAGLCSAPRRTLMGRSPSLGRDPIPQRDPNGPLREPHTPGRDPHSQESLSSPRGTTMVSQILTPRTNPAGPTTFSGRVLILRRESHPQEEPRWPPTPVRDPQKRSYLQERPQGPLRDFNRVPCGSLVFFLG